MSRFLRHLATTFLALLLLQCGAYAEPREQASPPSTKAADFSAKTIDDKPVRLSDILSSGKGVLLNFWGIRCGACLMEMPFLDDLARKFDGKVVVLGVNTDGADAATIRNALSGMGMSVTYSLLTDPGLAVMDLYRVSGVPMTFLIARDGSIVYRHENFEEGNEKEIEQAIVKLLGSRS